MKRCINGVLILSLTVLGIVTVQAQQQAPKKKPAPLLTNDDLIKVTGGSSAAPVLGGSPPAGAATAPGWARISPGDFGLSVEMPVTAKTMTLPIPADAPPGISNFQLVAYDGGQWRALVSHHQAASDPELKNFAAGFVEGLSKSPGVANLQYSLEPNTASHIPIQGSFDKNGISTEFNGFVDASGNQVWMILALYPQANTDSRAVAVRIIQSVSIDR